MKIKKKIESYKSEVSGLLAIEDNDFLKGSLVAYNAMLKLNQLSELEDFLVEKMSKSEVMRNGLIGRGYLLACEKILWSIEQTEKE